MLSELGYRRTIECKDLDEAVEVLESMKGAIRLFVSSWDPYGEPDVPLARFIIQRARFDLAPLLLTYERNPMPGFFSGGRSRLSRVDGYIVKAFGKLMLQDAISDAHRRRGELRDTLLLFSERFHRPLSNVVRNGREDVHFTTLLHVSSTEEMDRVIQEQGFRIGALLMDPLAESRPKLHWLRRFKKSNFGLLTPVGCLSTDPSEIGSYRLGCDLFLSPPDLLDEALWEDPLRVLSRRVTHDWEVRAHLTSAQRSVQAGLPDLALSFARKALKADPDRWECHGILGELLARADVKVEAISHLEALLETQPCFPRAHVFLSRLYEGPDKRRGLEEALRFCPAHPELRALAQAEGIQVLGDPGQPAASAWSPRMERA